MPHNHKLILKPPLPKSRQTAEWNTLYGAALGLAIAETAQIHDGTIIVIFEDQRLLQILESEINFFLPAQSNIPVRIFPGWECLPYDMFSPHPDIVSARLKRLAELPTLQSGVILVQSVNLMQRLPPLDYVAAHAFSVSVGDKINLEITKKRLINANYHAVSQVISPGEFAVRGGLIDVFPMGSDSPFRLDLFDDEVDSIRLFEAETQITIRETASVEMLPAREFPMNEEGILKFRANFRKTFDVDPRSQTVYSEVSARRTPPGVEFYFPLFFDHTATLFDYLPQHSLIIAPHNLAEICRTQWAGITDRYENCRHDIERRVLPPEIIYANSDLISHSMRQWQSIKLQGEEPSKNAWNPPCQPNKLYPVDPKTEKPYYRLIDHLIDTDQRVLLVAETPGRMQALEGVLISNGLTIATVSGIEEFLHDDSKTVAITSGDLERGLTSAECSLEIISESQLYGEKVYQRRRRSSVSRDPNSIIKSLAELNLDDPVVHIEQGIGRYKGLQTLQILGYESEYLTLEYANNDKLYIPILSLNLISRFIGGAPDSAPLHNLGGEQWQKAKARAQEKAYDVATELLEVEAMRAARDGKQFATPEMEYQRFAAQFPFEETPDQQQTIEEVVADLNAAAPMDRLVCGDVGFGKTEVALRAAFIVTHNAKQIAMLVPTTLLAHQHYQSFMERFNDWPVNIAMLSRFNSKKEITKTLSLLKSGNIDIVIGTHRLLQEDIRFSDLGLLIIDEEHRFGVRQKEKLKKLRSQVDILTLTATPIPRTLNITMSGLRSISIIATPPLNRVSIKTFVRQWSKSLIREACLREILRGGQIFFLHNDVKSIERTAQELAELVPEAEINIGHGQMKESQLERIMQDFYHQRFNLLICTTIIESGIDIPTANTIIVNRADRFGLAQLHQLRGRVGRSHHQAYAYLLVADLKLITSDARKRLDAISSMEDLGAGFALASHDLEIRGAGELLGETQSGSIDDVGYALYSEYLAQAVASIEKGKFDRNAGLDIHEFSATVDLHVPALFPADYLDNAHSRLVLYKRIANAISLNELKELQIEIIDRFGLLPEQSQNLFKLTAIRLECEALGIKKLELAEAGGMAEFKDNPAVDLSTVLRLISDQPNLFQLGGANAIKLIGNLGDADSRFERVNILLTYLKHGMLQ